MMGTKVHDILGRLAEALVDKVEQPGSYKVEFNGGGLASGVYFYRIQSSTRFRDDNRES